MTDKNQALGAPVDLVLGIKCVPFVQAMKRRFKKGEAFVVDDGSTTYLDGIECQYAVYVSAGKVGEYRVVGHVFDRRDALLLARALMPNGLVTGKPNDGT
jgi:hypothetical protein